jgi:predicted DNA-binding ribbon-helix-helix protein
MKSPKGKSLVEKRSIVIGGRKTSVSLEEDFWEGLKEIADESGTTVSDVVQSVKTNRRKGNLSSAVRVFILRYYQGRK